MLVKIGDNTWVSAESVRYVVVEDRKVLVQGDGFQVRPGFYGDAHTAAEKLVKDINDALAQRSKHET